MRDPKDHPFSFLNKNGEPEILEYRTPPENFRYYQDNLTVRNSMPAPWPRPSGDDKTSGQDQDQEPKRNR